MDMVCVEQKKIVNQDAAFRSLQMPKQFLLRDILKYKDSFNSDELVLLLAKRYRVSEMQVIIRLLEVGETLNLNNR